MYNPNTLGKYLRNRRSELGLTLSEFGMQCDVSPSSISFIETGRFSSPSIWILEKVAIGLGDVNVLDLIDMVDRPNYKLKKHLQLNGKVL